jgi:hypothetical protein
LPRPAGINDRDISADPAAPGAASRAPAFTGSNPGAPPASAPTAASIGASSRDLHVLTGCPSTPASSQQLIRDQRGVEEPVLIIGQVYN